jgi:hypothetical protein
LIEAGCAIVTHCPRIFLVTHTANAMKGITQAASTMVGQQDDTRVDTQGGTGGQMKQRGILAAAAAVLAEVIAKQAAKFDLPKIAPSTIPSLIFPDVPTPTAPSAI